MVIRQDLILRLKLFWEVWVVARPDDHDGIIAKSEAGLVAAAREVTAGS